MKAVRHGIGWALQQRHWREIVRMLVAVVLAGGMLTLSTPAYAQTGTSPSSNGPNSGEVEAQTDPTASEVEKQGKAEESEADSGSKIPGWVKKAVGIVGDALDAFGLTDNGRSGKIAGVVGSIIDLVNGETDSPQTNSPEKEKSSGTGLPPTEELDVPVPSVKHTALGAPIFIR